VSPSVSVITATFGCAADLSRLIGSLRAQTDRQFDYLVIDGGSTDGTLDVIASSRDVITHTSSEPDRGIYDALNKGIGALRSDFYLVVGADDILYPEAIARYKAVAHETGADVVVADVKIGNTIRRGYHPQRAWYGHHGMVTSHSVGMLFRSSLHERFGLYSLRYPLLADGYFIKRACTDPQVRTVSGNFVAGEFGVRGSSHNARLQTYCELWQIQLATGESPLLQYLLFQGRMLKLLPGMLRRPDGSPTTSGSRMKRRDS
jgi:glycosyltransferase involved in cell wall biosynthesis